MLKSIAVIAAGVAGSLYVSGAFDPYPRTVEGDPQAVMASLADLDIREQPGAPGSTAASAGGVKPVFRMVRSANRIDWIVLSGSEIATTMTATFEPVGEGRTRIAAWVERGDAPDERTSPAFRSEGLTFALFQSALNAEINEISAGGWRPECDAIRDELMLDLAPEAAAMEKAGSVTDGIVAVGGAAVRLAGVRRELVARGCNPNAPDPAAGPDGFVRVRDTMGGRGGSGGGFSSDEEVDRAGEGRVVDQ